MMLKGTTRIIATVNRRGASEKIWRTTKQPVETFYEPGGRGAVCFIDCIENEKDVVSVNELTEHGTQGLRLHDDPSVFS